MSRGKSSAQALRQAAEVLGGSDRLAAFLAVPVHSLDNWLSCYEDPPPDVVEVALDVLIDDRGILRDERPRNSHP
jgi:hypothetical protein